MVLLDGDILVRRNMDELMELELDSKDALENGNAQRVFAAAHACACNPMKKPHYPAHWYVSYPIPPRQLDTESISNSLYSAGSPKTAPTPHNTNHPTQPKQAAQLHQPAWEC